MKKILAALLALAMGISGMTGAAFAAEDDPFAGQDSVNIVYLGGSITQGAGVTDKTKCWVNRIGEYFKEKYPQKTINNVNAGLGGTGTDMGIMRLEKDVLSKKPDYVFIEFAVNDIGKTSAAKNMESIVRSLQGMEKVPYITFVYTAKYNSATKSLQNNAQAHQTVADYYGIPAIDLKPDLENSILSTGSIEDENNVKNWLVDLTHPTEKGYDSYTKTIQAALETGNYYVRPQEKETKLDINAYPLSTQWIDVKTSAKSTGTWTENKNPSYGSGWTSSTPGDTLEYTFYGPVLGIQHRIGKTSGQYSLEIDGKNVGTLDTYYSKTESQGVLGYQNFALGAGEHRIKITMLDSKNEAIGADAAATVAFDYFITQKDVPAYRWVNESFEDCDFSRLVPSGKMTYDWTAAETAHGSKGAMQVTVTGNSAGPSYRCETKAGTTYQVSAWIKVANINEWTIGEHSDKVRFIFQPKVLNDNGSWGGECYTECVVMDAGIISGDWVKVSAEYVCDGKGKVTGVADRKPASDVSRVEIRLGSGNLATTTGSDSVPAVYYVDDFKIEPKNVEPAAPEDSGNIIKNGNFNSADDMADWVPDSSSSGTIEYYAGDGAENSTGSALVKGTQSGAKTVGIKQQAVPVRINRAYKVTYWFKAVNDAAVGAYPQMILEYKGKQLDPTGSSANYYQNYDMGSVRTKLTQMTDTWQKMEYIYKVDGITSDVCIYPSMYIRLYNSENGGSVYEADKPEFLIDNIKMEELDIVYDGDFSVNPTTQVMNKTAKYKYPWGKYNNDQTGINWKQEADADGTNSYLQVRQINTSELMTYVDLEEGETYKISLYARLDDWETKATSALEDMYLTAIFNRARGDLSESYNKQYQYIPEKPEWILSNEWQKFEQEFTVPVQPEGVKYRSPSLQFRLGTGKDTVTYSLDGVKIEKISGNGPATPVLSNLALSGDPVAGTALTASVDYSCSSTAAAYIFKVYAGTGDADYVEVAYSEEKTPAFSYTPASTELGKKLKFEVRAIAVSGEYSNILIYETKPVASGADYETGATAAFDQTEWASTIKATCRLTAGSAGAEFNCMIALYDEEGVLLGIKLEPKTLSPMTEETVPLQISAPRGAYRAKLMVWSSFDGNMQPYAVAQELINL